MVRRDVMKSVDDLTKKEIVDLLGRCWMTHDGMWFYHTMQAFGIDEANRLNKAAIAMLAPMEIGRMKKTFGLEKEKIETFAELVEFFERASALFVPDFMNATFSFPRPNTFRWEFKPKSCFAYKGISRIGIIEQYECGVIYRVLCWLSALGIEYKAPEVSRCRMIDSETCTGEVEVELP
jgi:hypothetical protein